MSKERGLLAELLHRRVPQIMGMYVAATWMAIEIGDWASEQFGLAANLTLGLFVFLAAMLPSVVLVAWGHGAPGRDLWRGVEKVFLPINVVLALVALRFLPSPGAPDPAVAAAPAAPLVEERTLVDETGAETLVEVPAIDYFERVAAFPWENRGDAADDWLGYGIPILLEEDIDRSHFLGLSTLFDLQTADELRAAGFPTGRDLPRALRLRLARERGISYLVEGSYRLADGQATLQATLIDVARNEEIARFEATATELMRAADEIAGSLAVASTPDLPGGDDLRTDLAIAEHFTESLEAARLYVEALSLQYFDNDYDGAIAALEEATTIDPTFAAGFARSALVFRAAGKPREALAALDRALGLDYKLESEERFILKAERYGIVGDSRKAMRVLEMLTEVHPNSAYAFRLLGANLMVLDRIDEALAAFQRVRELDPSAASVLLTLSDIRRMKGEFERAEALIEEYLASYPDDDDAVLRLGSLYRFAGDIDAARETYERAGFLTTDDFAAELELAKIDMWTGELDAALDRMDRLAQRELEPGRIVTLAMTRMQLYQLRGQIRRSLEALDELAPVAQRTMSPLQQIFAMGAQRAGLQALLGEHEQALAEIEVAAGQVQPPLDGFFNFSRISVYQLTEDAAGLRQVLDQTTAFAEQYQFPFLEPFIKAGLAKLAYLEGRYEDAVALNREAATIFRRSVLGVQEPYVADYLNVQLSESLRASGQLEDARSTIEGHLRRYPADGQARLEYARVLRDAGDLAGARAEVEAVARLWQDADDAFVGRAHLAAVAADLGDPGAQQP